MTLHRLSPRAAEGRHGSFETHVAAGIAALRPRDADVLRQFYGFEDEPRTLDSIGQVLGITRERVRQIKERGLDKLRRFDDLRDITWDRLDRLLDGAQRAVALRELRTHHPWFAGAESSPARWGRILTTVAGSRYHVWPIGEHLVVSRHTEDDWKRLVELARSTITAAIPRQLTHFDVSELIEDVAASQYLGELAAPLLEYLEPELQFDDGERFGQPVLVCLGIWMQHHVRAVLASSDHPLHVSELIQRLRKRGVPTRPGERFEQRVRLAARQARAFPFGLSLYGDSHHIPLSPQSQRAILSYLERVVIEGPRGRQWHADELVAHAATLRPTVGVPLDAYIINAVLSQSTALRPLGRLVWMADTLDLDTASRTEVFRACETCLEAAGRPMRTAELLSAVEKLRGIKSRVVPAGAGRVIRVDRGVWGLAGRDD